MNDFVELRQIITTILKKWWLVVLVTGALGALGYLYSLSQTPIYEARTSLIVGQTIQAREVSRSMIETSQEVALTYADIAKRFPVVQGAIDELGLGESWQDLRKRIEVNLVQGTQLLEIATVATTRQEATMIADEIARQLILLSPSNAQRQDEETKQYQAGRIETLKAKIQSGEEKLAELEAINIDEDSTREITEIQAEINTLAGLINEWEANYNTLITFREANTDSANNLAILEPAQATDEPVSPRTLLNTLVATILGFVLSIGLIFLLDFLDDTLGSAENVARVLDAPYLGSIAKIKGRSMQDRLIINQDPYSDAAESYRLLRSKVQFLTSDGPKIFLITSPHAMEGRTTTVANLGVVMAQAGLRTIIVDGDLREPMQHEIFGISNDGGLGHLLRFPDLQPQAYLKRSNQVPNLRILNSGNLPPSTQQAMSGGLAPSPSELLGSSRMAQLLANLREQADVIIIDSPPAVPVADASVLANLVDGVLLVLDAKRSKREAAKRAIFNLRQARANILGTLFNHAQTGRKSSSRPTKQSGDENLMLEMQQVPDRPAQMEI